ENVASRMEKFLSARVPIIKFKESWSHISVDISFNSHQGISSGAIVNRYLSETPVLKPMAMLIKHFLHMKGYKEPRNGGLGSYTTILMIMSFLQTNPHLQSNDSDSIKNLSELVIG